LDQLRAEAIVLLMTIDKQRLVGARFTSRLSICTDRQEGSEDEYSRCMCLNSSIIVSSIKDTLGGARVIPGAGILPAGVEAGATNEHLGPMILA